MAEYLNISFIVKKNEYNKESMMQFFLENFNLQQGQNKGNVIFEKNVYPELANKKLIIGIYEYEEVNFVEFSVNIPELQFHKESFENELKPIADFIEHCLNINDKIQYVVCSYEMNAYYLSQLNRIESFDKKFLSQFPIVYIRENLTLKPVQLINLKAQNIFV